jgi:hypothetical protein
VHVNKVVCWVKIAMPSSMRDGNIVTMIMIILASLEVFLSKFKTFQVSKTVFIQA